MLVRTRPLYSSFDQHLDRAFAQLTSSLRTPARRTPVVDAAWRDGSLELTVDLPGVPTEAVTVDVAGRALTLAARTEGFGWERSITLGTALDPEQVTAHHQHGRLTVVVGPVAAPERRSIEIDTSAPVAAVESSTSDGVVDQPADQPEGDTSSNG